MTISHRSMLASALVLVGAAAAPVIACSSSDGDGGGATPGDDAGAVVVTPEAGPLPATCSDGAKNEGETDVDCGGSCGKCSVGETCAVGADCKDGVCKDRGSGLKCQPATSTDGVKNGVETDIDCGGMANPKCADTKGCALPGDCASGVCKGGTCAVPGPKDGVQNGDETDVDCGGTTNNLCADALKCKLDADCASDVCKDNADGKGLRCLVPTYTDGKTNGLETDVDCGGDPAHPCAEEKSCKTGADCTTLGCNYQKKCAYGRSCTNPGGYGADTCGYGGEGPGQYALDKSWEDCCKKADVVPTSGATKAKTIHLDKYEVTAGRMRVFLESVAYDVRGFVQGARVAGKIPLIPGNATRTVLESAWDPYLPTSFAGNTNADEIADCDQGGATSATSTTCNPGTEQAGLYTSVKNHLGGRIFKGNNQTATGCFVGTPALGGGTHAFRFPDGTVDGAGGTPALDQNAYDEKAVNCVDYLMGQAFCVWDGGRLMLGQEYYAAWGPGAMPWEATTTDRPVEPADRGISGGDKTYYGCRFPWVTDADRAGCGLSWPAGTTIEYAAYKYSYEYPNEMMVAAVGGNTADYIRFISAPGRTRGRGPAGHADLIGDLYALTSNVTIPKVSGVDNLDVQAVTHGWSSNGSWEVHSYAKTSGSGIGPTSNLLNKYGKLGLRCAYP
ncbi:MAG: Tryptophan synthase alpha chain [Labilithrix sp.]|nr:Tryptophan synthase alpha chain [Labilithrix sp.]